MNVPTPPSAALPALPPSKKYILPSAAMTVVKAMGGPKRLRRARGMPEPMQQDSQRFPYMLNHSNCRDLAGRYATVVPPRAEVPLPNLGAVNDANARMVNELGSSERPVQSHPAINTGARLDGNEGTVATDVSPHNGTGGASQTRLQSRSNSSFRHRTPVTTPTTIELASDEDTMSWRAAWENKSTSHTSRNPSERGGLGADSRRKNGSTWIEETSRPVPEEYSPALRPRLNGGSRHFSADFISGTGRHESAVMDTSQEHPDIANQTLEVQTVRMLNWNTQDAWDRTSIHTNDCQRRRHASEMGLASDDTDLTVMRDRSTIQTTTIGHSGRATFAGTEDGSATTEIWSIREDVRNLANVGSPYPVYGCFRKQVATTSPRPTRGRKRGLQRSSVHHANLERTAKRPRATSPIWNTNASSVEDMVLCTEIVQDTNNTPSQTVPRFSPMDITCSRQDEHEAGPPTTEPNDMDTSTTPDYWSSIADQMHDVSVWSEENGFEEAVMYDGRRSRYTLIEAGEYDSTEGDDMQVVASGGAEDGHIRQRARNRLNAASDYGRSYSEVDMWDISSESEVGYSVREREQNGYWEAEDYHPLQRDAMRDITSGREEANDPEWDHDAIRDAEEYDRHGITNANVEDAFSQHDQYTFSEAEVRGSSEGDVTQVVTSRSEADSVKRGKHTRKRVRNTRKIGRKPSVYQPAERNAFKSRKRRMRRAGRSPKRRQALAETYEPMSIC